mmetsp:Transcript_5609/g.14642  ORF Transcript_5609/g.14642 Transcript_5609/m.14642 type:complete len:239 (+) Transcript_5609:548-1264(+)
MPRARRCLRCTSPRAAAAASSTAAPARRRAAGCASPSTCSTPAPRWPSATWTRSGRTSSPSSSRTRTRTASPAPTCARSSTRDASTSAISTTRRRSSGRSPRATPRTPSACSARSTTTTSSASRPARGSRVPASSAPRSCSTSFTSSRTPPCSYCHQRLLPRAPSWRGARRPRRRRRQAAPLTGIGGEITAGCAVKPALSAADIQILFSDFSPVICQSQSAPGSFSSLPVTQWKLYYS